VIFDIELDDFSCVVLVPSFYQRAKEASEPEFRTLSWAGRFRPVRIGGAGFHLPF
jgi:hypothetical protein